ncbi:hypothetical protein [Nocardia sp. XZ_19_369]|uniref:hypothetical protein n=1 Tax=Nocardia sp. XZ_19_369 TaxID=2769487 RepID=UPI00189029E5|nr:hypothetical protein [Nocardia sp. XZ_19_369]
METAYAIPFVFAVASVLMFVLGFDGVWVVMVSVLVGMFMGKAAEGLVGMARAYRSAAQPVSSEPVWRIWQRRTRHDGDLP